ncbi:MAG: hypothetical protein ACYTE8_04635 [Planctomycetota bacterium]|jgi:hypothetical protein
MKKLILLAILFCVVLVGVCFAQTNRQTIQEKRTKALELVHKYTQALDSTASFIEHYEETGELKGNYPANHPYYARHGGKSFRYQVPRRGVRKFKENKGCYQSEYAWGYHAGYFNDYKKYIPKDKPLFRVWISMKDIRYFHQGRPGGVTWRTKHPTERIKAPSGSVGITHLLGYLASDDRVDVILSKARRISLRDKTENVKGSECFVIDAHTRYGQYSVWLDPEHGYHAAKIRRSAKEGEYFNRPDRKVPAGSVYTEYLDVLEFKKVGDKWVPVEANAGYHRTIGSPAYYIAEDKRYKRTHIILDPDHDKLGSFADPIFEDPNNDPELVNGTLFKIRTNSQPIYYTWRDGKIFDDNGKPVDRDKLKKRLEDYYEEEFN